MEHSGAQWSTVEQSGAYSTAYKFITKKIIDPKITLLIYYDDLLDHKESNNYQNMSSKVNFICQNLL